MSAGDQIGGEVVEAIVAARESTERTGDERLHCPAHPDGTESLTVRGNGEGRALVRCHAGCSAEEVVAAVGLTMRDLWRGTARAALSRPVELVPPKRHARSRRYAVNDERLHEQLQAAFDRLRTLPDRLSYLTEQRGLSREVIDLFEIGRSGREYTIPVYNPAGGLVNIRRYRPDGKSKMTNTPGCGSPAQLFPFSELERRDDVIVGGSFKRPTSLHTPSTSMRTAPTSTTGANAVLGRAPYRASSWGHPSPYSPPSEATRTHNVRFPYDLRR